MDFYPPITPNNFFHIYNRGNNRENIFTCHDNYIYFLKKYDFYLSGYLDTYAYCLLPNHFHLLVKVKDTSEWGQITKLPSFESSDSASIKDLPNFKNSDSAPSITDFPSFKNLESHDKKNANIPYRDLPSFKKEPPLSPEKIISRQFRLFFMSYSKSINKQNSRIGSLFQKNFKRKQIDNNAYLQKVIHYIHANPVFHGICKDYKEYHYSSFSKILTDKPSKLMKAEVLEMFGGKDKYNQFHNIKNKGNLPESADNEGME